MPEILVLQSTVRAWLLDGPLAEFVPAYVARLKQGRYALGTARRCVYQEAMIDKSAALKREKQIQSWSRKKKLELVHLTR